MSVVGYLFDLYIKYKNMFNDYRNQKQQKNNDWECLKTAKAQLNNELQDLIKAKEKATQIIGGSYQWKGNQYDLIMTGQGSELINGYDKALSCLAEIISQVDNQMHNLENDMDILSGWVKSAERNRDKYYTAYQTEKGKEKN